MAQCEFHNARRCQKDYAVFREDQNRYLCNQHYEWHEKFSRKLRKALEKTIKNHTEVENQ